MEGDNNKIRHHKTTGKGSVDRPTELICVESIDGHCVEGSETKTWMVVASAEESIVQQVFPGQWATFALIHSTGVKPRTLPMLGKYSTTNLPFMLGKWLSISQNTQKLILVGGC